MIRVEIEQIFPLCIDTVIRRCYDIVFADLSDVPTFKIIGGWDAY